MVSTSSAPKRKLCIASTPGPRSKHAKTARALSGEPKFPDSESEENSGDDENDCGDDDEDEGTDPAIEQKAAKASKEFESACRRCKSDANKALKAKYDLQISKLKSEHKQELRELKADKAKILFDTKTKANKNKAKLKGTYEGHIKDIKCHRDEKIKSLVYKHKKAIEEWQEKADVYKKKISNLTTQQDDAEAKHKECERSAAETIKAAKNDLKAGERKLQEERKHTEQVEKDLNDTKKYIAGVDGRADVRHVRAQEKLELQETNLREHANRVITLQRENYTLKDTNHQLARLGREKRDEIDRLKAELQSTKAELGVVRDMEEISGGIE